MPVSPLDQALFHFDQGPTPWSVHFEVRVPGRLDDERVAAAATAAANRHPTARARLLPHRRRDRRLHWEIPDRVDHVALDVVDCPDDGDLADARSQLLARRVDLAAGPPFALTLAHRPDGDSLIMNLSHVAGDGTSGLLLLRSIATAYAGLDDGPPQATPTEVADLQTEFTRRPKRSGKPAKRPKPTALVAVAGGQDGLIESGFGQLQFDPRVTAEIFGRRTHGATSNDVLLASLAVAIRRFNDERGEPPATVSLLMPIDLRRPGRATQIMSNVFFSVSVPVFADEQSDVATAQSAIAPRTRLIKARRLDGDLIGIPSIVGTWPLGVLHVLARILFAAAAKLTHAADAAVVTNLGRLDAAFDFGPTAGSATELWITPPVQMPPGIGIGAVTMNDSLFIGLRYARRQFDSAGAGRFLALWRDVLLAHDPEEPA
jgi:NRPS condensation-like uncharacterized protein